MTDDSGESPSDPVSVSAADQLASEIRRLRRAARLSQAELAAVIGYSPQYVSLAERPGKGLRSAALVRAIDDALDANGALVRRRQQAVSEQQAIRRHRSAASGPDEVTSGPDDGGRDAMRRRDLLAAGGVVAIRAALPAPNPVLEALDIVAADGADTFGIALDCLNELVSHYSEALALVSPARIYHDLLTTRSYASGLLERAGEARRRPELLGAAGRLSNLLAISTSYLGNHGAALIWCVDAERLSDQSGIPDIAGWAALTRATVAYYQGQPQRSVDLARRGLAVTPAGSVAYVKLAAQQMRAFAMLRNVQGMTVARRQASKAIAALPYGQPTTGMFSLALADDPPYTATSMLLVENFKEAASVTSRIIGSAYPDVRHRATSSSYARTLLILALAEAGLGRLNEAVRLGREALDVQGVVWPTLVLADKLDRVVTRSHPRTGDAAEYHTHYREVVHSFNSHALAKPEDAS